MSGPSAPSARSAPNALERGDTLGRYVVLELLGRGGMGEVYAAYDPELDRKVALKVIHAALRDHGDPELAKTRLIHEAQTLAKLSHPNVVAVYDVGSVASDVYVAMEFVEGADVRRWLKVERTAGEIIEVYAAAARGLAAAHDAGLVHRDFKPENVLIGDDGRVRVIDFGIARVTAAGEPLASGDDLIDELSKSREISAAVETRVGALVGTPAYMAPEQFLGTATDSRTDQFSLCIALWESLAGERPFAGDNVAELSDAVIDNRRRAFPADLAIPERVREALDRGLQPEPDDRFESITELIELLEPPPPRANRALIIGATVTGVAGIAAAIAVAMFGGASEDACAKVGDEPSAIFGPQQRRAVERAIVDSDAPGAAETWRLVSAQLSDYATDWTAARREVCRASRRGDNSAALTDKRVACLDARLKEMRAVVDLLASADAGIVDNAVEAARGLSRIDECNNLARLAGAPDISEAMAAELAELKALNHAGQYARGIEKAREVVERATAAGQRAARARALMWLGTDLTSDGKLEESVDSLFEAVRVARDAGDTYAEAHAWTQLVYTVGARLQRGAEGERWARQAEVVIRQDGSSPELEAKLRYYIGQVHRVQQRYDEALAELRQAIRLHERAFGADAPEVLSSKLGAASALRGLERTEEAIELQRQVLEGTRRHYGADHPKMTSVHNNLANSLVFLREYDEAREHYKRSLELKRQTHGDKHPSIAVTLNNLALLEERLGDFDRAAELFEQAHALRVETLGEGHPKVAGALEQLARVARKRGDLDAALALQSRAVERFRALGADQREHLGSALVIVCDLERRRKSYARARALCDESIEILEKDARDVRNLADALTSAAEVAVDSGRHAEARSMAERALAIRAEHKSRPLLDALTHYVAARAAATDAGSLDRARALAAEAAKLAAELHPGDREIRDNAAALVESLGAP